VESAGYSRATKARLDGSKLKKLGWQPQYEIRTGIIRTVSVLKDLQVGVIQL
jgi:nucleoside-diphosphate-sugar epimerase